MSSLPTDPVSAPARPFLERKYRAPIAAVAVLVPAFSGALAILRASPHGANFWQGVAIACASAAVLYGIAAAAALLHGHSRHGVKLMLRDIFMLLLSATALSIDRLGHLGIEEVARLAIGSLGLYVAHLHLRKESIG